MLGDIYLADLNPSRGSEQAGIRPVIIVQRDTLDRFTLQYTLQMDESENVE